jgi:hypothetical protein
MQFADPRRHQFIRVFLLITTSGYHRRHVYHELHPNRRTQIMTNITVGHTDTITPVYLDQHGNPMLTPVVPDSPPVWSNTPATPPVDTFTPAADGSSATLIANAAGSDVVNFSVVVGGKTFTATDAITISAAPQVLTSVELADSVV